MNICSDNVKWYADDLRVDIDNYVNLGFSFYGETINMQAELYWIQHPNFNDDINQGYIGVTNQGIDKRFQIHKNLPKLKMQLALNQYPDIYPIVICSGHYFEMLKLERYFRLIADIGWNTQRGGSIVIRNPNAKKAAITRKENIKQQLLSGELTQYQKCIITRQHNDQVLKAQGQLTSGQKVAVSIRNHNELQEQLGKMTSYQKGLITRKIKDDQKILNGELTSCQKVGLANKQNRINQLKLEYPHLLNSKLQINDMNNILVYDGLLFEYLNVKDILKNKKLLSDLTYKYKQGKKWTLNLILNNETL